MKLIKYEDALQAITKNLDRINYVSEGTMRGVAEKWLEDVEVVEVETVEDLTMHSFNSRGSDYARF